VFNFEAGCYAKMIRLSPQAEPEIYATTRRFGTLLENVVVDDEGRLDLDSEAKTENTRGAYSLEAVSNALPAKRAGHPTNVVFLTADAFGVMPPIARLSEPQAAYHFLSGFTARLAGTEIGVTEPAPVFSPCFGGPFLPQPPAVYARLLHEKLLEHRPSVWLVNTGWTGGAAGQGGHRMPIAETRALLHAALPGALDRARTRTDPVFGFEVPTEVPGVDTRLLDPRSTWADAEAYDAKARELVGLFRANFEQFDGVDPGVAAAGP
jgi:phosphoenolpyruvate carboxykinase (ATP)